MSTPQPVQRSADSIAENALAARQDAKKNLLSEGWTQLHPPMGDAAFYRGDDYLNALGEPVDKPAEPEKDYMVAAFEEAHDLVEEMSRTQLAAFLMGPDGLRKSALKVGLHKQNGESQKKFLSLYSDDQLIDYLKEFGLDIDSKMQRPALEKLVHDTTADDFDAESVVVEKPEPKKSNKKK